MLVLKEPKLAYGRGIQLSLMAVANSHGNFGSATLLEIRTVACLEIWKCLYMKILIFCREKIIFLGDPVPNGRNFGNEKLQWKSLEGRVDTYFMGSSMMHGR